MNKIKRYLSLWLAFVKNSLARELEFKGNFVIDFLIELFWMGTTLFALEVIFTHTTAISGWSKGEVMFLYGFYRLGSALATIVIRKNVFELSSLVNEGGYDFYLTKPVDTLFLTFTRKAALHKSSFIFSSLVVIFYALSLLNQPLSIRMVFYSLLLVPITMIIRTGLEIVIVTPIFWLQKLHNIQDLLYTITKPASFPRKAFPPAFEHFFTFAIPILFTGAIPAEIILNKAPFWLFPASIIMAIAFTIISRSFFYLALRHYSSASS